MRVAVMQPYFFPYAGYFRLFCETEQFVIYDCVQFPRRGRVHRTEVPGPNGTTEWLTLPLARHPRSVAIQELEFATGARSTLDERLSRYQWLRDSHSPTAERLKRYLFGPLEDVVDFLEEGLKLVLEFTGIETKITRSSSLDLDQKLRGQDRIIAIVKAIGGTSYVNSPGGRSLYRSSAFQEQGIELRFLPEYEGPHFHMLHALSTQPIDTLIRDIRRNTRCPAPETEPRLIVN